MNRKGEAVPPPDAALLDALADQITTLIPELDYPTVRDAVGQAAGNRTAAAQLGHHLDGATGLLDSPCSAVPPALIRIAHLLHPHDPARIVLPACTGCARALPVLAKLTNGGRLCHTCATRADRPVCATCGKNTSLKDENGAWQCRSCRGRANRTAQRAARRVKAPCDQCGNIRLIVKRTEDGQGLCGSCNPYQRPLVPCIRCARERPVHARLPEGPVCACCHTRPQHPCGLCGTVTRLYRREREDLPAICASCYQKPKSECEGCGKLRACSRNRALSLSLCVGCRTRRIDCAACSRTRPFGANLPLGEVCDSCYGTIRRKITECPACGALQPMLARAVDGTAICGPCAGRNVDYSCPRCHQVALKGAGDGLCYRCAAADRATALLADYTGADRDQIAHALLVGRTGEAVWQWLAPGKPAAALLERLVRSGEPVGHALLDAQPQDTTVHRLRAVLMHAGALPQRADHLERLVPWLDEQLANQPAHIAQPVRTWVHWRVLRRARRRLPYRPFTPAAAHFVRSQVRSTLRFLAWIDQQELTLATLTQSDLERWLTRDGGPSAIYVREFLRFAATRGQAGKLAVPAHAPHDPLTALDEDERWHHLRRALNDEELPTDLRALGALILLYGIPFTRIRELSVDDLDQRDDAVHLTLDRRGGHRLRLAGPVADLLARHLETSRAGASEPSRWLFPGAMPGQPASEGLRARLARHGFPHLGRARAAALITLLEDVPPPVLASLLGIHPHTAEHWARYAQPDWAAYLHARTTTAAAPTSHAAPARA